MKQLMDYIVAALVLLLCWPLLLYIAIRIRMQGTGCFLPTGAVGKGRYSFSDGEVSYDGGGCRRRHSFARCLR